MRQLPKKLFTGASSCSGAGVETAGVLDGVVRLGDGVAIAARLGVGQAPLRQRQRHVAGEHEIGRALVGVGHDVVVVAAEFLSDISRLCWLT